jgi:hypothetical protein
LKFNCRGLWPAENCMFSVSKRLADEGRVRQPESER